MCRFMVVTALFALASGCVGGSKEVSEKDKERLAAYELDAPPPNIPNALDIDFDGKVKLIGYRVDPAGPVNPGQKVKTTLYWKVEKAIGEDGWNLFTHVVDGAGERVLNIDNVGPLREWRETRQVMWPSGWKAGKVYVDEQDFTVPRNVKTAKVQIVVGIYKESARLKVVKGATAGDNRAVAATLEVKVGAAEPPASTRVPQLRVDKLAKDQKIKIDGKLDEEAWKTAPQAGPFVDVGTGKPNDKFPVKGTLKLLYAEEGFYVGFDVKDPDVTGGFDAKKKDPHLWTQDCVEIMVDPDGDGDNKDYYEIQINPQNLVFDSQFDEYNKPRTEPDGPFGNQDWSSGAKSAVVVDGTLDKADDKDTGYVVEAMFPWKSFGKAKKAPPELGDRWRMNFYAMEKNSGVAWSAILNQGNFHKASRFGKVLWAETGWSPPSSPPMASAIVAPSASAAPFAPLPSGLPRVMPPHGIDPSKLPRLQGPAKTVR